MNISIQYEHDMRKWMIIDHILPILTVKRSWKGLIFQRWIKYVSSTKWPTPIGRKRLILEIGLKWTWLKWARPKWADQTGKELKRPGFLQDHRVYGKLVCQFWLPAETIHHTWLPLGQSTISCFLLRLLCMKNTFLLRLFSWFSFFNRIISWQ